MATILCIEDHKGTAMLIKDLLELHGHSVSVAEDGQLGYEMALTNQFNLLIVDMMLPRMHGDQLVRDLLENPLFRRVPILLMTGGSFQPDPANAERIFMGLPYILKPINTREVPKLIEKMLEEAAKSHPDAPQ